MVTDNSVVKGRGQDWEKWVNGGGQGDICNTFNIKDNFFKGIKNEVLKISVIVAFS